MTAVYEQALDIQSQTETTETLQTIVNTILKLGYNKTLLFFL